MGNDPEGRDRHYRYFDFRFLRIFLPFNPNVAYAVSGEPKQKVKTRYPPSLGQLSQQSFCVLAGILAGRVHRFKQQLCSMEQFPPTILTEFLELLNDGYTVRELKRAWFKLEHLGEPLTVGQRLLSAMSCALNVQHRSRILAKQSFQSCVILSTHLRQLNAILGNTSHPSHVYSDGGPNVGPVSWTLSQWVRVLSIGVVD